MKDKNGLGKMLALSAAGHLVLYFALTYFYFPHEMKVTEQVCYVDMVNLPVESPRQGNPAPAPAAPAGPSAPATPPAAPPKLSRPAPEKVPAVAAPGGKKLAGKAAPAGESQPDEFQKRIAALQEARDYEAKLEALRRGQAPRPAASTGASGMPTGTGTQSGSDYTSFIHSRLKDAFRETMDLSGGKPQAVVQLSIDRHGQVTGIRLEKPSGDKRFDESVMRAIRLAEKNFVPPPGGGEFRAFFIFRPEGVGKK